MRMRLLGNGHHVSFWASQEVHNQIRGIVKKKTSTSALQENQIKGNYKRKIMYQQPISSQDVIEWALLNTKESIENGFIYWASQGLLYYRKQAVFKKFEKVEENFVIEKLANLCVDEENIDLANTYGVNREATLVTSLLEKRIGKIQKFLGNELTKNAADLFGKMASKIKDKIEYYLSGGEVYSNSFEDEQEVIIIFFLK